MSRSVEIVCGTMLQIAATRFQIELRLRLASWLIPMNPAWDIYIVGKRAHFSAQWPIGTRGYFGLAVNLVDGLHREPQGGRT